MEFTTSAEGAELSNRAEAAGFRAHSSTTKPAPKESAMTTTTRWNQVEGLIRVQLDELNELLGLTNERHKASFGYIGNGRLGPDGWNLDDCLWSIYLPHPGRVGTSEDRLGSITNNDVAGLIAAYGQLKALIAGVKLAKQFA